ncbi:MAG: hypothetical protein E7575_04230 [Ruminococcaceae bacterium]|nr:hypothetical protein [Oscillospiraceae bacterium]
MKRTVKIIAFTLACIFSVSVFTGCGESLKKKKRNEAYEKYDRTGERYDYYLPDYVDVCDYKGIEIPDLTYAPSEEDIENKKTIMAQYYCERTEDPDRAAIKGDVVSIITTCKFKETQETYHLYNFEQRAEGDGESFVLGCGYFYFPELDNAVIGMKQGETKKVELTLPDPFYKDILNSGKVLEMEITLCWIDSVDYSAANDDFYFEHYSYKGDSLREYIIYELREEVNELIADYKTTLAWNYICENSKLKKLPEKEVKEIYNSLLNSTRTAAQEDDMTLLEYVSEKYGYEKLEDFYAYLEECSEQYCYEDMIYYYIVRCENLKAHTDSDDYLSFYEEKCLEMADPYGITNFADAESFLIYYYGDEGLSETMLELYTKKWIADACKVRSDINQVYSKKLNK